MIGAVIQEHPPHNGELSPTEWIVDDLQGLRHAMAWPCSAENGIIRNVTTRCEYGTLRTGQAAVLKRGTPTCLACMVSR